VLAVAGVAAPAAPERENSGLPALWQEFPLDSERVDRADLAQRQSPEPPPTPRDEGTPWLALVFLGVAAVAALVLLAWATVALSRFAGRGGAPPLALLARATVALRRFAGRRGKPPAPAPAGEGVADAPATPATARIHLLRPSADAAAETAAEPDPPALEEVLKEKLRANTSFRKHASNDAHVLKEKLARAAEPARPGAAASTGAGDVAPVLPAKLPLSRERDAPGSRECEITWSRRGEKSRFVAVSQHNGGRGEVSSSRPFRWRKSGPPPQTSAASAAFQELVESLEEHGWRVCGHGDTWYSARLSREPDADRISNVQE
jgi:hypothetical protein